MTSDKGRPVFTIKVIADPSVPVDHIEYHPNEVRCHPSVMPEVVKTVVAEAQAAIDRFKNRLLIEANPLCPHCGKPKTEMEKKSCAVGGCPLGSDM
jgi:hypothetical protein